MNTTENNKLIAGFMGDRAPIGHIAFKEYEYHTSWDWLMPVVEKIEEITMSNYESFNVVQQNDKCFVESNHNGDFISFDGDKKQATYKAVVEFIKWYNENK